MIPFNVPPVTGKEEQYIAEAIASHKICGDGQFTKKCHDWFETHFFKGGGAKNSTYNIGNICSRNGCYSM